MSKDKAIGVFERYLSLWVLLCMGAGILIGKYLSFIPSLLQTYEYAHVSLPIAVLIWIMILPMMLKIDFESLKSVGANLKGLYLTWIVNWVIKPFTMYGIAALFFYVLFRPFIPETLAKDYLAGAILLGAAPCTAMVFVWSHLTKGNPAYTLVQVASNDMLILVAFAPLVAFLLGIGGITVPWDTLAASVVVFVVLPLAGGTLIRRTLVRRRGIEWYRETFLPKLSGITVTGLLATLILLFSFQGEALLENPFHILLIAVPLTAQTVLVFFITYGVAWFLRLPHDIAAPSSLIGASNFFELSVAAAISLFGTESPVVLATIVGVLVEVPVMLSLVGVANATRAPFRGYHTVKS